jgi:hypothetical protein
MEYKIHSLSVIISPDDTVVNENLVALTVSNDECDDGKVVVICLPCVFTFIFISAFEESHLIFNNKIYLLYGVCVGVYMWYLQLRQDTFRKEMRHIFFSDGTM